MAKKRPGQMGGMEVTGATGGHWGGASDQLPQSRAGASLLAFGHHLPRPRLHFGGWAAHSGGPSDRASGLGLGDRHFHALLRHIRNSVWHAGRPYRAAPRAYADRTVVVRLHFAHGSRDGLLSASVDAVSL